MLTLTSWLEKSRYRLPSKSQKWLPDAAAMGSGSIRACADQEWKTWARSSRETCAPREGSAEIWGSGKVLIGGLSCVRVSREG